MAVSMPRSSVVDLVAKLEVITKDHGCLVDLSAILDVSVCPSIDLWLPKPHSWDSYGEDYVVVTPTPYSNEARSYTPQPWCPSSTVEIDVLALVELGLIVEADLDLYINLLNAIKAEIDIDIELDVLINLLGLNIGGHKVNKCTKHFQPHCHKKIPAHTPGCKTITASDANDCLNRCHAWAAELNVAANVQVGNIADIKDCLAISFDGGLSVDNCVFASVPVLGLLVEAEADVLVRL